ncbi:very short patch repair endonuclease [Paenibacillus sp. 32352]|uniref:very short patch repair endonuclease n=1 Tax=Paenibacillus sp. 32352 TaxID=1969111 RepID=UPI0009AEA7B8|nr:very short patch repair endonuclease [Paenibacillus sp. 32352]
MSDIVSKEQRSRMMSNIRSVSRLEDRVSQEIWHAGVRYRRNDKSLFGKPDFSIKKYKLVIFIDSCFWHGCPLHANIPKTNREFWQQKLERNMERDLDVTVHYQSRKWNILRIWEHDLKNNFRGTMDLIVKFIEEFKAKRP